MIQQDRSNTSSLIQHYRDESAAYLRQWILWLGVGSAGAEIALISLAANLPNRDFAFHVFLPSLWTFLIGVVTAGVCLLFASRRASSAAEHFAAAHNRDELSTAASKLPLFISAPERIADDMNRDRNQLTAKAGTEHGLAERAWRTRDRWHWMIVIGLSISAAAFVLGTVWLLVYVTTGGPLVPPS